MAHSRHSPFERKERTQDRRIAKQNRRRTAARSEMRVCDEDSSQQLESVSTASKSKWNCKIWPYLDICKNYFMDLIGFGPQSSVKVFSNTPSGATCSVQSTVTLTESSRPRCCKAAAAARICSTQRAGNSGHSRRPFLPKRVSAIVQRTSAYRRKSFNRRAIQLIDTIRDMVIHARSMRQASSSSQPLSSRGRKRSLSSDASSDDLSCERNISSCASSTSSAHSTHGPKDNKRARWSDFN